MKTVMSLFQGRVGESVCRLGGVMCADISTWIHSRQSGVLTVLLYERLCEYVLNIRNGCAVFPSICSYDSIYTFHGYYLMKLFCVRFFKFVFVARLTLKEEQTEIKQDCLTLGGPGFL